MKKILLFVLFLMIFLVSCSSTFEKGVVYFKVLPQETYEEGTDLTKIKNSIIVCINGKDYTLTELENNTELPVTISGASFEKGNNTLVVSYAGSSISFPYEVTPDTSAIKAITNNIAEYEKAPSGKVWVIDSSNKITLEDSSNINSLDYVLASKAADFIASHGKYYVITPIELKSVELNTSVDLRTTNSTNYIKGNVLVSGSGSSNIDVDIYGDITINNAEADVVHYGQAENITLTSCKNYVENGVVSKLTLTADSNSVVNNPKGIIYNADISKNAFINKGVVYRFSGSYNIENKERGFVYQIAIDKDGTYNLPNGENNTLEISSYRVTSVNIDISDAETLVWFSKLTQSGKSPLIQDQPIVYANVLNDINLKGYNWVPIANWNYWANGVAARWFGTKSASGWENFVKGDTGKFTWDFVSEDEFYCKAFYNYNYEYNENKVESIYYIRLVLKGKNAQGEDCVRTISNINNAFLGCVSDGTIISNLNLNYYADKQGKDCVVYNNLDGLNYVGYLDTEVNTHFGLFCNNLYIPANTEGAPRGTIEFSNITLGGTFKYRNCPVTFGDGNFVIGAFASLIAIKGYNNGNPYLTISNCVFDKTAENGFNFLVTKKSNSGKEMVSQWGSSSYEYKGTSSSTSCNYAYLADYCCGTSYNGEKINPASYTNIVNSDDLITELNGQYIKKISNYQGSYYDKAGHYCSNIDSDYTANMKIWPATCERGNILGSYCAHKTGKDKDCCCCINTEYVIDNNLIAHDYDTNSFELVNSTDELQVGDTIIITRDFIDNGSIRVFNGNTSGIYIESDKKSVSNNQIEGNKDTLCVLRVAEGKDGSGYAFINKAGRVLLAGTTNEHKLTFQNTITENTSWEVTIDNGTAKISCKDYSISLLRTTDNGTQFRFKLTPNSEYDALENKGKIRIYRQVSHPLSLENQEYCHCDYCDKDYDIHGNYIEDITSTKQSGHYELVKDASELKDGMYIAFVVESGGKYYSYETKHTTTGDANEISITNNSFSYNNKTEAFKLISDSDSFVIQYTYDNSKKIYGKSAAAGFGSSDKEATEYSTWKFVSTDNNMFRIENLKAKSSRCYLSFDGTKFCRVTSDAVSMYIYKYVPETNIVRTDAENGCAKITYNEIENKYYFNNKEVNVSNDNYAKITNNTHLYNDEEIVLVNKVINDTTTTYNVYNTDSSKVATNNDGSLTIPGATVLTIEIPTNKEGKILLKNDSGKYICSYSKTSTSLGSGADNTSPNIYWSIKFNDNNTITIVNDKLTYKYINYNNGFKRENTALNNVDIYVKVYTITPIE